MIEQEITGVTITPKNAYPNETIKIIVNVVTLTEEPKMYSLPFVLGDNQGGGF